MDPMKLKTEQQKDEDIQTAIQWKRQGTKVDLKYEPISRKNFTNNCDY